VNQKAESPTKRFEKDSQPFDDEGLAQHIKKALRVKPPSGAGHEFGYKIIKRLFDPVLVDTQNLPDTPCLFVANHSLFALDGMVMGPVVYHETGRFLRGLGDRFLFSPATEDKLLAFGGVVGHPKVCSALMENGADLMVFPGGAHEATKTMEQRYTLQWKERYGFVRLAAQHGYTIMPTAIVGPDEFYSHLIEGEDLPDSMLGKLLTRLGLISEDTRPDLLPPIPIGALGSLMPKPQRCYYQFGEPVNLSNHKGQLTTKKQLTDIRNEVAEQIESMLPTLLHQRAQQSKNDGFLRRLLTL
jgi:1-acyl-sn-glycerol-3-phosphate acyltransferase